MMSREIWYALSAKADWEGGWPEYVLDYGIDLVQVDDKDFRVAISNLEQAWIALRSLIDQHIDEYGEYPNE